MAHEIEQHDGVVLHREKAWHGLGTIVENAPTPTEALQIARLDWSVEQWPLAAQRPDGGYLPIKTSVANVRSDVGHVLGIVGDGYQPIQNRDLAEFCTALAEQDDVVKIESAGSIRNGAKVWFLLKGEIVSRSATATQSRRISWSAMATTVARLCVAPRPRCAWFVPTRCIW